jgi:hypothetical protein
MRTATGIALALVLLGAPLAGCGGDKEERAERGLAVPHETATPESSKAMQQTDAERQQALERQEDAKQKKAFDERESGEK